MSWCRGCGPPVTWQVNMMQALVIASRIPMQHQPIGHDAVKSTVTFREMRNAHQPQETTGDDPAF
jgi:hypothetical protein